MLNFTKDGGHNDDHGAIPCKLCKRPVRGNTRALFNHFQTACIKDITTVIVDAGSMRVASQPPVGDTPFAHGNIAFLLTKDLLMVMPPSDGSGWRGVALVTDKGLQSSPCKIQLKIEHSHGVFTSNAKATCAPNFHFAAHLPVSMGYSFAISYEQPTVPSEDDSDSDIEEAGVY